MVTDNRFVLVDIGASGGPSARWKEVCPDCFSVLFEPDPRASTELLSSGNQTLVLNTVLSDQRGEIAFQMCRAQPLSSVYEPNLSLMEAFLESRYLAGYEVVQKITMPCDTLDNQMMIHEISDIDFIKIDVEGYELPVLKGASRCLERAIGLEVEVEFLEVRKHQALFPAVHEFITSNGFDLYDFEKSYFRRKGTGFYGIRKGQVIFGIGLYFVPPERFLQRPNITETKIMNAARSYIAYGYFDSAEVVLNLGMKGNVISQEAFQNAQKLLERFRRRFLIPNFRGKGRIHKALARITRAFGGEGVNCTDMGIGNF